jgi:hypothetical protein
MSEDTSANQIDNEREDAPLVPLNDYEDQILGNNRASSRESDELNNTSIGYPASESGVSAISASTIATPNKSAKKTNRFINNHTTAGKNYFYCC